MRTECQCVLTWVAEQMAAAQMTTCISLLPDCWG